MTELMIGYARVSTDAQDLTAQRNALAGLGVAADRIYVDQGLTGTNRERPGLRQDLAACRAGDTLVVAKLDRLARSLPDARAIADQPTIGVVKEEEPLQLRQRRGPHEAPVLRLPLGGDPDRHDRSP